MKTFSKIKNLWAFDSFITLNRCDFLHRCFSTNGVKFIRDIERKGVSSNKNYSFKSLFTYNVKIICLILAGLSLAGVLLWFTTSFYSTILLWICSYGFIITLLSYLLAFNFTIFYLDDFNYSDNKYVRISQRLSILFLLLILVLIYY